MKTTNQYFMYGLLVPYDKYKKWETDMHKNFPVGIYGDIFCFFESRERKYMMVGKKIKTASNDNPILVPELTETEENEIKYSILNKFGFEGDYHYYFVIN